MSEPAKCAYIVWRGSLFDPAEYCPNVVDTPYSDEYCGDHLPPEADDDAWLDAWPLSPDDYEGLDE